MLACPTIVIPWNVTDVHSGPQAALTWPFAGLSLMWEVPLSIVLAWATCTTAPASLWIADALEAHSGIDIDREISVDDK